MFQVILTPNMQIVLNVRDLLIILCITHLLLLQQWVCCTGVNLSYLSCLKLLLALVCFCLFPEPHGANNTRATRNFNDMFIVKLTPIYPYLLSVQTQKNILKSIQEVYCTVLLQRTSHKALHADGKALLI